MVDPGRRAEGLGLRMKDGMDDLSPEEVCAAPLKPLPRTVLRSREDRERQ
jgi:hypothetical protein